MLKITDSSKVYVHCPAGVVTGGAELLHQLVSTLNNNGRNAFIVYFGKPRHTLPEDYRCYNISIAETVDDRPENIEVVYEGRMDLAFATQQTQKMLWWLSVDNFYHCSKKFLAPADMFEFSTRLGFKALFHRIMRAFGAGKSHRLVSLRKLRQLNALNAYQSEYAQNFLQNHGFKAVAALKDFINTDHITPFDTSIKEDIVLYNPKKGAAFTKRLMAAAPDLKWVALQGMSREELIHVLRRAKVYIDFGNHPGKDRLPRECAMNGCCIITGMRGAAGFYEDVMLPSQYKFNEQKCRIDDIIATLRQTLSDYSEAISDFSAYRRMIACEKAEFELQAARIFGYDNETI